MVILLGILLVTSLTVTAASAGGWNHHGGDRDWDNGWRHSWNWGHHDWDNWHHGWNWGHRDWDDWRNRW